MYLCVCLNVCDPNPGDTFLTFLCVLLFPLSTPEPPLTHYHHTHSSSPLLFSDSLYLTSPRVDEIR